MENLASLCGATITDDIYEGLAALPKGDKQAVLNFGVEFAFQQCKGLLSSGASGVHIYTMDRWKTTSEIVARLRVENIL